MDFIKINVADIVGNANGGSFSKGAFWKSSWCYFLRSQNMKEIIAEIMIQVTRGK